MTDLKKATKLLKNGATCVAVKGDLVHVSHQTGIAPLLEFADRGIDLAGFSVADKIVGKAAALLFVRAGIICVYAEVLSAGGKAVLAQHGIPVTYNTLTAHIINRAGTDICPMEKAVAEIDDPQAAYQELLKTVMRLRESH